MLVVFGVCFFVAIATFKQFAGFKYSKPIGLWIIYLIWPVVCVVVYTISQLMLVLQTLEDRWPIGDIVFGVAFFTIGQVLLFAFSVTICNAIKHYIDGLFFFTLCMLLSVMMVYKYWDSITVSVSALHSKYATNACRSARISSSQSAPRRQSGKSRTHFSLTATMTTTLATTTAAVARQRALSAVLAASSYMGCRADGVTRLRRRDIERVELGWTLCNHSFLGLFLIPLV